MPRPRPADQPGRLLDAAEELFADLGHRDTTATEIAKRAGVATATLYHYFESKDILYEWVLARAWDPDISIPNELPLGSPGDLRSLIWDELFPITQHVPHLTRASTGDASFSIDELATIVRESYDINIRFRRIVDLIEAGAVDDESMRVLFEQEVHAPLVELRRRYLTAGQQAGRFATHLDIDVTAEIITTNVAFYARSWRRAFPLLDPDDDKRRETLTRRLYRAIAS